MILVASVFLQFCYGLAYVWSVFQPFVKKRFSMDDGSANMPFAVLIAAFSLGNILGGFLQKKVKAIYIVIFGNVCISIGMVLTAFIPVEQGYLINITYGVLGGLGGGMAYNTTVAVVQKCYPKRRGLVTGILICSTGSFGLIMNPFAQKMLKSYGFQEGTLKVALVMIVLLFIGSSLMTKPLIKMLKNLESGQITQKNDERNFTVSEVVKTPQYYRITLSLMLAVPCYFLMSPMLMTLSSEKGFSETTALLGVMLLAVMNTTGRLIAPWASDGIGNRIMLLSLYVLNIIAIILVLFSSKMLFIVAIAMIGFAYGGFMGMYPTITAEYFGSRNNGINYGIVLIGYGISSLSCPYLVKAVHASSQGNSISLAVAAFASVAGVLLIHNLKIPRRI